MYVCVGGGGGKGGRDVRYVLYDLHYLKGDIIRRMTD